MARKKKGTLFGKNPKSVIRHPGSETKRAQEHGRSLHEQAEIDSHSPDKHIRGKGNFALAAQSGKLNKAKKLNKRVGKKKALALHDRKLHSKGRRKAHSRKRSARKRA